jgi:hypothetical protein
MTPIQLVSSSFSRAWLGFGFGFVFGFVFVGLVSLPPKTGVEMITIKEHTP